MELRDYVRVLRRSWMLMLAFVVLGGLLAAGSTWRSTKEYAASVTMVVSSPDNADGAASAYQGGLLSQQRVKSYANLVASDRVAMAVIHRLHLRTTPDQLRGQVTAQAVPDTVLLKATVRDRDPRQATSIADAVGEEFSDAVAMIERPADDSPPSVRVNVWERAKLPTSPVAPQPTRNMALGLLLGLILGITAAIVRFRLDTSISGQDDARDVTDLPNLAMINYDTESVRRPLITNARPHSARAEAFRQLRTNLQFVDVDAGPRSILVSSSVPGEGKTTTVCNLAISLAQGGHRVCLIEGDLRRPSFSGYLGVESAAGLTSVLIGAADLDDVLQPWGEGRVGAGKIEVLASGPVPPNPSELLGSQNMADLIDLLHTRFDFVLLDAPPLLPVTDAAVLATRADGVLLVARVGRTRREQLRRATETLRAVDARMVGTVLNMVPTKGPDAYYFGQYSSYAPRGRHARAAAARATRMLAPDSGVRPAGGRESVTVPAARESADADPQGTGVRREVAGREVAVREVAVRDAAVRDAAGRDAAGSTGGGRSGGDRSGGVQARSRAGFRRRGPAQPDGGRQPGDAGTGDAGATAGPAEAGMAPGGRRAIRPPSGR
ncbi:putative tyrosine-protein kinase [Frankia canadensis]|uniref:non-specific protein-tyrosine kinase n=1 Tax=Frankia canadensis TaxID=1836972 RepID=A0A2I2KTM2_9ACTN|nr:polysaccharide biosynthesis tyrosine autokinase [Frankia canadensis]SNQ49005.1 putative tyrosine-protein kinase [Frankia canadensis]SOU56295.1 putative tyrosine-protein kinase [Frankia canadensis]